MKHVKMTADEKAEAKQIKKQWTAFIARMKKKGALVPGSLVKGSVVIALIIGLASCSPKFNVHSDYNVMHGCGAGHRTGPR